MSRLTNACGALMDLLFSDLNAIKEWRDEIVEWHNALVEEKGKEGSPLIVIIKDACVDHVLLGNVHPEYYVIDLDVAQEGRCLIRTCDSELENGICPKCGMNWLGFTDDDLLWVIRKIEGQE